MGHGTLQTVVAVKALVLDSPMPHSFPHQIVCDVVDKSKLLTKAKRVIVTPFTHEPTHKTVWGVRTNGNVFPGLTVWDVHTNGNIFPGLTVWDVHRNGKVFPKLTV